MLRRNWPTLIAAGVLLVAAAAAVWTWVAVAQRQDAADVAEWAVGAAERQIAENPDAISEVRSEVVLAENEVAVLEGMLQPGTAEAMAGVYLMASAAGCEAGPAADAATLLSELPASAIPSALVAHPGWESAVDTRSIAAGLENCDG